MKFKPAALFSLVVLIFFCVFVYEAKEWRLQARLYPWAIGIPMLICAIIQVVLDFKGVKAKESSEGAPMDFQFQQTEVPPEVVRQRTFTMFAWMFGFFAAIWLVGYVIAIPLMVFGYLKFQSGESWTLSVILTSFAFAFFYSLFVKLLNLPFPDGALQTMLGLV